MQNVNLLFNKLYYDGLSFKGDALTIGDIKKKQEELINSKFDKEDYQECTLPGVSKLQFKTQYPGLLVGTGYAHGVSCKEDAKLGFSLDYVTGQPYVPGSSVKGTLRSIFEDKEIICEILSDSLDGKIFTDSEIITIINEIFDGGDIFLDAVIKSGDKNGKVLGIDYITPHKKTVENPTPIQMLKIISNVTLEFRFVLKEGLLSKNEKLVVFSQIIEDFGVGAKTNVGYGNLKRANQDGCKW